jgi:tetratricopeptide (TPR) repeat protein
MRCSHAHKLIGDKLDGALSSKDSARLREHLDKCSDCRDLLKDFQGIVEQAKGLPKHEPSHRVWTAVLDGVRAFRDICDDQVVVDDRVARVVRDNRVAGPSPSAIKLPKPKWYETYIFAGRAKYALAAALLLVVVGGVVIGLRPGKDMNGLSEQARFTLAKLEEAEKHYKLAIRALSEAVGSQTNRFDPLVVAVFARNLYEIDTAIQACQAAVKNNPNDLSAREYLLGAYKDKVNFLDSLIDIRKASPSAKPAGKKI